MGEMRTLTPEDKNLYWLIVEDCLHRFHFMGRVEAARKAADLRQKLENPPEEIRNELYTKPSDYDSIYEDEPFDVACHVAGRELKIQDYDWRYQEILKKRCW